MNSQQRHRLFREHKYILYMAFSILQKFAKTDFTDSACIDNLHTQIEQFKLLIDAHANYEDERILSIIKKLSPALFTQNDSQHEILKRDLDYILYELKTIKSIAGEKAIYSGHRLHLEYTSYLSQLLAHFNSEETELMKVLHDNLTDDEIRAIDHASYSQMKPEQLFHMLKTLFPCFNKDDRKTFIEDIFSVVPDKLEVAWPCIVNLLTLDEQEEFNKKFGFSVSSNSLKETHLAYAWEDKVNSEVELMHEYHKK